VLYTELDLPQPEDLLQRLITQTAWQQEDITLFGRTHPQPRLVAWYGDPDAHYSYSGIAHKPNPWTRDLSALRSRMEDVCDCSFNSVLLNYYRNQRDSMGLHADDEPELGATPVIASLSLGEERKLYFKHKTEKERASVNVSLPSGSLLVMRADTQKNWKHGMRKLTRQCGPRVNLTFRRIFNSAELVHSQGD
jgi:alkylated DNA repair dioxygenase AlkB